MTMMMQRSARRGFGRWAARAAVGVLLGTALQATPAAAQCAGDCNGDGTVAINELIIGVNIALGGAAASACTAVDRDGNGMVSISELIAAVNGALNGCTPTTPQATATATPTGASATATATPTRTTSGDTPTATPTAPASCGNGSIEANQGETCDDGNRTEGPGDSCPANCRVSSCQRSGDTLVADVIFDTDPADLLVTGMTLFVRYPDGTVDVPGSNNDPAVTAAVTSDFFGITPNDSNFALTAVLIDPFFLGVNAGTAITVGFDVCSGAGVPPASAFTCQVTDATDENLATVTDQVTCRVVLH